MSREVRERIASDLQIVAAGPSLAARLIQTGQALRYIPPVKRHPELPPLRHEELPPLWLHGLG